MLTSGLILSSPIFKMFNIPCCIIVVLSLLTTWRGHILALTGFNSLILIGKPSQKLPSRFITIYFGYVYVGDPSQSGSQFPYIGHFLQSQSNSFNILAYLGIFLAQIMSKLCGL